MKIRLNDLFRVVIQKMDYKTGKFPTVDMLFFTEEQEARKYAKEYNEKHGILEANTHEMWYALYMGDLNK